MKLVYRRRLKSDCWHWCRNCSNWPTAGFEERTSAKSTQRPRRGELCNQCISKSKRGKCKGSGDTYNPDAPVSDTVNCRSEMLPVIPSAAKR